MNDYVGIDFGTSNSAVATLDEQGGIRFANFQLLGASTQSYRSLLFFQPDEQDVQLPIQYYAGVEAIEAYLEEFGDGRLIQSFKTHLTTPSLGRTQIGPHAIGLDDMLRLFFVRLRAHARRQFGDEPKQALIGRPVRFAGSNGEEDDTRAMERLRAAALAAGFEGAAFELEPIAAAYHYEQQLERPELVLVADFGGGTTDLCLMRLGPDARTRSDRQSDIVATGGVGVAGDDLDAKIIEHLVCPHLGKGGTYVDMGQARPIPRSYYDKLARWHHLSFLKDRRTAVELDRLRRLAHRPEQIENLIHVIETNQGFHLHSAVERLKIQLSAAERGEFVFEDGPLRVRQAVTRRAFEQWVGECVASIAEALDDTLRRAGTPPERVDRVFMTGGTAYVPIVRRAFAERFGTDKLHGGDELMSIASGLAVRAGKVFGRD